MEDQDTIERADHRATDGRDEEAQGRSDTDARAVLARVVAARRAEADARAAREQFIADQYRRGVKVIDIARKLGALADELDLDPRERRRFGVSESSVHVALRVAGLK